jgi:hypothetical protein
MTLGTKNILIAGYYGFHNIGDEAILQAMLDQFRADRATLTFTVISGDPAHTQATYAVNAVHWQDVPALSAAIKKCDLVVLGGGGLLQEYWDYKPEQLLTPHHHSLSFYGGIPVLAALHRKPVVLYALGIGPLFTKPGKELVRLMANQASLVAVRDLESKDLLQSLGVDVDKTRLTIDPAFGLQPQTDSSASIFAQLNIPSDSHPLIGVCLRNWSIGFASNAWKLELAQALDQFITSHNARVVFIPFQSLPSDPLQDDIAIARSIVANMKQAGRAHIIPSVHLPSITAGLISQCDLLVGMRLHSLIFALQAAVPVVALSYDPKIDNLLKQCGLEEYLTPIQELSGQNLLALLGRVHHEKDRLQNILRKQAQARQTELAGLSQTVLHLLDDTTASRTVPEFEEFIRGISLAKIEQVARTSHESNDWQEIEIYKNIVNRIAPPGSLAGKLMHNARRGLSAWKRFGTRAFLQAIWQRVAARNPLARGGVFQSSQKWQSALQSILEAYKDARDVVVILPNIKWNVSLFQRPQQMALAFARMGYLTLYLELSYIKGNQRITKIQDRLYRVPVPADMAPREYALPVPAKVLGQVKSPIAITYTYNRQFLDYLDSPRVVYEYIDELEVFPFERAFLVNSHKKLLASADTIVATAKLLYDEAHTSRPDTILNPNGVDYQHFARARDPQTPMPRDLKKVLRAGHPVIGYYGALARWFDYDLLAEVARQRPEWDIVLIGIDYDNTLHPSGLLTQPNVHWLGVRQYADLPNYLRHFDVATIPFKVNDITHSTSPLKMFEYFAGHKPVVTTAMREAQRYDEVVLIAHDAEEFIEKIELALLKKDDPTFIAKVDQMALANTWEARVEQVIASLK